MWARLFAFLHLCVLRVTPRVLLRRVHPPAYPAHVPVAVHRQHALGGGWDSRWTNTVHAAHAARAAHPDDARVRRYFGRVTTMHAALFGM